MTDPSQLEKAIKDAINIVEQQKRSVCMNVFVEKF